MPPNSRLRSLEPFAALRLGLTAFPTTRLLHGFPGFDRVVSEHPSDHGLTSTTQGPGLHDNPLRVRRWIGVGEAADVLLLVVHQPANTFLRY